MHKALEPRIASKGFETIIHFKIHQAVFTLPEGFFQPLKCLFRLAKQGVISRNSDCQRQKAILCLPLVLLEISP